MDTVHDIHVIIVAGGSGRRFGAGMPKQYCDLDGKPILCHTVDRMREALPHSHIVTVVSDDMVSFWRDLAAANGCNPGDIVTGGDTRWQSVKNAVESLALGDDEDIVLVHDGARPLVDVETVQKVVDAVNHGVSVVPVVPVTDSLRLLTGEGGSIPVERASYRAVVTPQGFKLGDLRRAYRLPYETSFTDDASVMAAAGMPGTVLVESLPSNIKITNPGDIALASWYIRDLNK